MGFISWWIKKKIEGNHNPPNQTLPPKLEREETPRTCFSCRYFREFNTSDKVRKDMEILNIDIFQFAKCAHPSLVNKISGEPGSFCDIERKKWGHCKEKGKLWQTRF